MKRVEQAIKRLWPQVTKASVEQLRVWMTKFGPTMKSPAARHPTATLACDFGQSKIAILEVQQSGQGLTISGFQKISRTEGQGKGAENLKACYEKGGFGTRKVRVSVKGQGVILRFIQFPKMKMEELRSAMVFEAEKYIPFKTNEVVVDFQIVDEIPASGGKPDQLTLLLVAVKRDDLSPLIQTFREAGLEIEIVDADALALINALEYFHPEAFRTSAAIFDFGREVSTLSVVQAGKPRFIRDISFGGVDLIKRLKRKLGKTDQEAVDYLEMDREPTPEVAEVLNEGLSGLVSDLKVSLDYYMDHAEHAAPVQTLFLGGGQAYHPIVQKTLARDLGIRVQAMDVLGKVQLGDHVDRELIKKNEGFLPVAMGLCLRPR